LAATAEGWDRSGSSGNAAFSGGGEESGRELGVVVVVPEDGEYRTLGDEEGNVSRGCCCCCPHGPDGGEMGMVMGIRCGGAVGGDVMGRWWRWRW
jgi:hypothetical protein